MILYEARQYDEALAQFDEALRLERILTLSTTGRHWLTYSRGATT
jgi:hypothetical protein